MNIEEIKISVFEMQSNTPLFDLMETERGGSRRWVRNNLRYERGNVHVMHVRTNEGIEGVCTVGDARYTTIRREDLEQLRILAVGEDPSNMERLNSRLNAATRPMFAAPGWFGAFDNCLWDIAGKVANQPVCALIGRVRTTSPAYFNITGETIEESIDDTRRGINLGFKAIKDHYPGSGDDNIEWFSATRKAVGPEIDLMHDAAVCDYSFEEAVRVGHALEKEGYRWFEEPLPDRDQVGLHRLCDELRVPVLAPESMMNDMELSSVWLVSGATRLLRVNARHGTTSTLKLAQLAEMHGTTVELNGPGGLFGLVHAHLLCAIQNTSYYEYFPGGTRDEVGKEIGLLNPTIPKNGYISPPSSPGWGAEWDWDYFETRRVGYL